MIAHVFKPRLRNKTGKPVPARLYRGRYRLDGDFATKEVALGVSDKRVAEKRLAEIIKEKEQERAGVIAPKTLRDSVVIPLAEHLCDFIDDLKTLGRTEKYYTTVKHRVTRILADINADGFVYWRNRQSDIAPKTRNE